MLQKDHEAKTPQFTTNARNHYINIILSILHSLDFLKGAEFMFSFKNHLTTKDILQFGMTFKKP